MKKDKETLLKIYRDMVAIRAFEYATRELYANGLLLGGAHLYAGEEAIATGVCSVLNDNDFITSTHRGHGHLIAKGGDLKLMMAELAGKATGYCKGKGGSMHICDMDLGILGSNGIVGAGLPIAVGAGYACKSFGKGQVSVCFFGDGASNRGTFHESITLAAAYDLPVIYVLENNFYGISGSQRKLTKLVDLSERAKAYGIPGETADGNDVMAVIKATTKAVDRARKGEGPTLLEFKTWRHFGHFEGDPDERQFIYRDKKEHEEWLKKDPIPRFREVLKNDKVATEEELVAIEKKIDEEIAEATEFAENSPYPDVSTLTEDVYA
ncbi:pyruvate dehydrogenase E1 component subunit alpha [Christensenellaceae bacterium]|nr:pyruvate dehydrogenase E1 component subunit alpha [Christensenellaceae bacterium]BDF60629.1 pyruvate dehydrogenase E1 component subunit alpha [Christensenellaceae bacterium]